ncbi:MAG: hypothetical protein FWD49_05800 [Firmicutes bacterium]|nr:hypothetical protein [Bacillota bacterium]
MLALSAKFIADYTYAVSAQEYVIYIFAFLAEEQLAHCTLAIMPFA